VVIDRLVRRVQHSDKAALMELYDFYRPLMLACVKRCVTREPRLWPHREDIESDCLPILEELVRQYDPELAYFSYYLSTRMDYALISTARKHYLGQTASGQGIEEVNFSDMPPGWQPESTADALGRSEWAGDVVEAMKKLKPRHREAIQLTFFDGITQEEAAQSVGVTQSAYCKRLQRALRHMRQILVDEA